MNKGNINELVNSMRKYIQDPVLFVRNVLKVRPDKWQEECLQAIAHNSRVAVRSGHGVGKTALESWVILWFLFTRPFPKIPCTAPTQQQLLDILWPEISKWLKRSELMDELFDWQKTKIQNRIFPERWFATARTASKPENMAGFHEEHLLFIIDEASGVSDQIYETIEGALTTKDAKLLLCGNPTKNFGVFKRAFFEDRYLYYTIKVNCMDTSRVAPDYCQRLIRQYGIDSDVVRVRVMGEFPKSEPDGLIPLEKIEAAMMREIEIDYDITTLHIGADIARFGDDETTIVPRIGNKTLGLFHYTKQDTTVTAGKILSITLGLMKEYNKPFASVRIDDDGVGGGVTDILRERVFERNLNIEVIGCHNGGRANNPEHYANWITEQWCNLKQLLDGDIEIPNDDELSAQLSTRKYSINSKGQIILEDKKTYKKRTHRSPDRADGLILAYADTKEVDPNIAALLGGAKLYGNY